MTSFRKVQILTKRIVNSKGVPQRPQRTEAIHYFGVTVSSRGCCFDLGVPLWRAGGSAAVACGGLYQARGATRPTQPSAQKSAVTEARGRRYLERLLPRQLVQTCPVERVSHCGIVIGKKRKKKKENLPTRQKVIRSSGEKFNKLLSIGRGLDILQLICIFLISFLHRLGITKSTYILFTVSNNQFRNYEYKFSQRA